MSMIIFAINFQKGTHFKFLWGLFCNNCLFLSFIFAAIRKLSETQRNINSKLNCKSVQNKTGNKIMLMKISTFNFPKVVHLKYLHDFLTKFLQLLLSLLFCYNRKITKNCNKQLDPRNVLYGIV